MLAAGPYTARVIRQVIRSPALPLFAMALCAYAYFYQAGGWNQNSRFDLTRALVEQGSASIDAYHHNTGDKSRREGHYYCDKAPGVSYLAVPAYAACRAMAAPPQDEAEFLAWSAYASTVWAVGVPAALAVLAIYFLLGALGISARKSAAFALAYGLATLAFPYATLLYGHQTSAAFVTIGFALVVRERARETGARASALAAAGSILGAAVAVEYPAAIAVMAICIYAAATITPRRQLLWTVAGLAVMGALVAAYHWSVFGGPFTLPYEFSTQPHRSQGVFMGIGAPAPEALWGITFSTYRGLFYSAPWLLLAVPGAIYLWQQRYRAEVAVCAAVTILYVWLNASLVDWQGGWAMGARYLVPAIPFLVILAAGVLTREGQRRGLALVRGIVIAGLIVYSAAMMLVGTAVKPEVPTHIREPFATFLLPAFRDGRLAISTQSIDSISAPRHAEPAAWNLGQTFGLDGVWSLAPLLVVLAMLGAWLVLSLRPGRG